jgi:hypothetical protein
MKTSFCYAVAVLCLICASISAQQPSAIPSSLSNSQQSEPQDQSQGQSLADLARKARKDHSEDTNLTPQDAKKLFSAVDKIAAFAAEDSGFPLRTTIKRRLVSPDEVEKSARAKMSKEEYSERFARSEITMKKFGLLPRNFDLKEFLIKVNRKEIAGYYDDESKSISLVNTIPLAQQEAVLAHELTHALQDQNYDLRTWAKGREAHGGKESASGADESSTARRAVVEGQAMVVYVDYLLARVGRSVQNTPGIIYRMEDPMVKATVDSQMMHDAPMLLREGGTFPYREGLIFENELLQAGGKRMAFAGAFADPPRNTHEVIQPRAYLDHEKLAAMRLPDVGAMLNEKYEVYDSGSVGELDVRALLWQFGSRKTADELSKNWQGGRYVALRKKSAMTPSTGDLGLLYVSRWSSAPAAEKFARFYVDEVVKRYQTAKVQTEGACSGPDCPISSAQIVTEEGPVVIELWKDNTVLVSESFDRETAAKLSTAVREVGRKTQAQQLPQQELATRLYELPAFRKFQKAIAEEMLGQVNSILSPERYKRNLP